MGNFYVNFTTSADRNRLIDCLRTLNRKAFVSPASDGITVFYDAEGENHITSFGRDISQYLNGYVLAVSNHDDDILNCWLFHNGETASEYDSFPGYFDDGDRVPRGADAGQLCAAFGCADDETVDEVDAVLTEEEDYAFALDRHKELAMWLGIPWEYACINYANIEHSNLVEGTSIDDFLQT